MRKIVYLFAIAGLTLTSQAWAGPQCTTEPKTKWQDAKAFEAELAKTYSIKKALPCTPMAARSCDI